MLEALPVQEVVFVKVRDTSGDLAGHPLQLQQLSISEHPILLRQIAMQIPLHTHTHTDLLEFIIIKQFNLHDSNSNMNKVYVICIVQRLPHRGSKLC